MMQKYLWKNLTKVGGGTYAEFKLISRAIVDHWKNRGDHPLLIGRHIPIHNIFDTAQSSYRRYKQKSFDRYILEKVRRWHAGVRSASGNTCSISI